MFFNNNGVTMMKYQTDSRTPRSIPEKYRNHIEDWSDERHFGNGYFVTLVGLTIDPLGPCHCFSEDTIKDVISTISTASKCNCDICESLKIK